MGGVVAMLTSIDVSSNTPWGAKRLKGHLLITEDDPFQFNGCDIVMRYGVLPEMSHELFPQIEKVCLYNYDTGLKPNGRRLQITLS